MRVLLSLLISMGLATGAFAQGDVFVDGDLANGGSLGSASDVDTSGAMNGFILCYTNGVWTAKAAAIGGTPVLQAVLDSGNTTTNDIDFRTFDQSGEEFYILSPTSVNDPSSIGMVGAGFTTVTSATQLITAIGDFAGAISNVYFSIDQRNKTAALETDGGTFTVDGNVVGSGSLYGFRENVVTVTNDIELTLADAGRAYLVRGTNEITITLPTNITAATRGTDFTFVNLTTNILTLDAFDTDYIDDSDTGAQIYSGSNDTNLWPFSSITLKQADSNWWHVVSARGDWTSTGSGSSPIPAGVLPVTLSQVVNLNTNLIASGQIANSGIHAITYTGTNVTWDANNGNVQIVQLTNDVGVATPSNAKISGVYVLYLQQDAMGSRLAVYSDDYDWGDAGAPTLSTAASAEDIVTTVVRAADKLNSSANLGFAAP
jgi:hypothetical protein